MKLIDDGSVRPYVLSKTESHKSVTVGAALVIPYMPPHARAIQIQAVTDDVRYTLDGTTPTASVGFRLIQDTDPTLIDMNDGMILKLFGEGATSKVEYQWFD